MTAGYPFQVGSVKPVDPAWYLTVNPPAVELKTLLPIDGAFPRNSALVSPLQPENAERPMLVTPEESVTSLSPLQSMNA